MFYRYRRFVRRNINRLFYSINAEAFAGALDSLGLKAGDTVCVHSELSRLGYLDGGPQMLIAGLQQAVGESGCVMMPSYPTNGSSLKYCESGQVFDVRNTPSKVGALTEIFRNMPGVRRSWHATNSMAAWGARADHFLRDHHASVTPFGPDTPYGRLAEAQDAYILMLGVPILSLLHHLQERVDFPNLFMPETYQADFIDEQGKRHSMQTRFILPRIPFFVAVPSGNEQAPDWALLHDFALIFPGQRERDIKKAGYRFPGYEKIFRRRAELQDLGILTATRLGRTEVGLLRTRDYIAYIEPELRALIGRYRDHYDPAEIRALNLTYM